MAGLFEYVSALYLKIEVAKYIYSHFRIIKFALRSPDLITETITMPLVKGHHIFLPGGDIVVVVVVSIVDINSEILLSKQSLNSSMLLDDVLQVWILLITLTAPTQKVPLVEPLFATCSKNCS